MDLTQTWTSASKQLAMGLRHLTTLSLGDPEKLFPGSCTPKATIMCLDTFARYFSKLESLTLNFNALNNALPGPLFKESQSPSNGMLYLGVLDSPIEDPLAVAACLSDLFPRLLRITSLTLDVKRMILWNQAMSVQLERVKRVARGLNNKGNAGLGMDDLKQCI
jgi:hypothetical protein